MMRTLPFDNWSRHAREMIMCVFVCRFVRTNDGVDEDDHAQSRDSLITRTSI